MGKFRNARRNAEKCSEFTKTFDVFRILKQLRRISGSEHAICPNISAKQNKKLFDIEFFLMNTKC